MRLKGNRYYAYERITDPATGKRRQIEFALEANLGQETLAIINHGKALECLERGELPNGKNLKFKKVAEQWKRNPVCLKEANRGSDYNLTILNETLVPYFGEIQIKEISKKRVRAYLGLMESDDRPVTANHKGKKSKIAGKKKSTLQKELRVLRWVMQSVSRTWEVPYWEFKNLEKEKLEAPTFDQVRAMIAFLPGESKAFGKEYQDIGWIMAMSGLDTSDVLRLSRSSLKDGLIIGRRGKTGQAFKIGNPERLSAIFQNRKTVDFDPKAPFFRVKSADAVSKAVSRAFDKAGFEQFHAKSLRDFHASALYNAGYAENLIQDVLGHAEGSKQTRKYTIASRATLKGMSGVFDSLGKSQGGRK